MADRTPSPRKSDWPVEECLRWINWRDDGRVVDASSSPADLAGAIQAERLYGGDGWLDSANALLGELRAGALSARRFDRAGAEVTIAAGYWNNVSPIDLVSQHRDVSVAASALVKRFRGAKKGPGGRDPKFDWPRMRELAEAADRETPGLSRSKLADSLVAEYADKVHADAPDKRSVERHLKEWGIPTEPVVS